MGILLLNFTVLGQNPTTVFIEAESFANRGGWVIDQQSMDVMQSAYLMAHGLGVPVTDATTSIHVPSNGKYSIWVRTKDWVAPWHVKGAPGKFQLFINNQPLEVTLGTEGADWHWQYAGRIKLSSGNTNVSLHDLTGFNGRCDAIVITKDKRLTPPNELADLSVFRDKHLKYPDAPEDAGAYDLVVVGGGIAGICAAVSAARLGSKVALIQNRPILGGNNSSEVRVGLSGLIYQTPYGNLGALVDELGAIGHWTLWEAEQNPETDRSKKILEIINNNPEKKEHNAGVASNYDDNRKLQVVRAEENLTLFLNTHVIAVDKKENRITAAVGKSIITGKEYKFRGTLFADCTGDGTLGYLAGADFRVGREAKSETGEPRAPNKADKLVMGTSVQWNSVETKSPSPFSSTSPWAVKFDEKTAIKSTKGDWDWETGARRDQVKEIERIRDYALRVTFGNWDYLKNKSTYKDEFASRALSWVAYIGGKRESRRLMGDVVLKEQHILEGKKFRDATFTTTWGVDLHYPIRQDGFTGEPFLARADIREIKPYQIPYRCLYSRNVNNLFMAGRNISVTHVALGTVRVQRTTGMMGEVVGMAASICKKEKALPRDIYEKHWSELDTLLKRGIGNPQW